MEAPRLREQAGAVADYEGVDVTDLAREQAFWARTDRRGPDECWPWTGPQNGIGYGVLSLGRRNAKAYAHRWSYEHHVGPIPDGCEVDHTCHDPNDCRPADLNGCPHRRCVNPDHLAAVTHAENVRRSSAGLRMALEQSAKTHCVAGHPFDEANTYVRMLRGRPTRACRTCLRANMKRYRERQKAARA